MSRQEKDIFNNANFSSNNDSKLSFRTRNLRINLNQLNLENQLNEKILKEQNQLINDQNINLAEITQQ